MPYERNHSWHTQDTFYTVSFKKESLLFLCQLQDTSCPFVSCRFIKCSQRPTNGPHPEKDLSSPQDFQTKVLFTFVIPSMNAALPTHLTLMDHDNNIMTPI